MKKVKRVLLTLAASLLVLPSISAESKKEEEPVVVAWYCKIIPFMCTGSALGNGDGEIPPKPKKG